MTRDLRSETGIDELARQFVEKTLPKPEWTHAAHFAVALWMLKRRGANAATELPVLIRSYNEATGVANTATSGYHETITLASLRAANSWLQGRPTTAQHLVLAELLDSPLRRSDWLYRHWSKASLFSSVARARWVEPDIEPLPFREL